MEANSKDMETAIPGLSLKNGYQSDWYCLVDRKRGSLLQILSRLSAKLRKFRKSGLDLEFTENGCEDDDDEKGGGSAGKRSGGDNDGGEDERSDVVREMRVLQIDGRVHGGVRSEGPRAEPRAVDMRVVREVEATYWQ
ncbi:PREDICTED: uncharacterized protein LOC109152789 [Ipomoea nil]|uniref:uncharacterized protein LOC109152789 n=1 Tax=Ipomoea nil TaxID=35883 RepID=UPI0009017774|nr:PREDICTED: uncharacterized protein LOC109152789 [Ipomoea nil]